MVNKARFGQPTVNFEEHRRVVMERHVDKTELAVLDEAGTQVGLGTPKHTRKPRLPQLWKSLFPLWKLPT